MASRKDFIVIADAMAENINRGYVKKKDIQNYINNSCLYMKILNPNFSPYRFEEHIKNQIKD